MREIVLILSFGLLVSESFGLKLRPEFLEKLIFEISHQNFGRSVADYENLTTTQIIETFGYVTETHHVVTEDGYILELHRIPYGINDSPGGELRPIAFLQHCLLCSSSDWVMDKPDRSLAYLLADVGYDVWMGNVRGNTYSRNHTTLDPDVDKREFWGFTWNEMAIYDLTASIDFALSTTGNTQVYYVGFSMGTTMFFVLMSEKPEYADKIKVAALMGPVTYVDNIKGPLKLLGNFSDDLDQVMSLLGYYEFLPSGPVMDYLAENFCAEEDITSPICSNILFLIAGYDKEELNEEYLPIVLSHTPAGTSVHTVNHYGQMIPTGVFQKYNWGKIGNQAHYGQDEPPLYNLGGNTPPIGLYWGQNDWLATPEGVVKLAAQLTNVVVNQRIDFDQWNHLDFVWALHAKEYVYDYLIEFIGQY